jgi:pre-mRNA-processing factor 8
MPTTAPPPGFAGAPTGPKGRQANGASSSKLPPPPGFVATPHEHAGPSTGEPSSLSAAALAQKSKKWTQTQSRRFGDRKGKTGIIDTGKQELPPEHLRKIMKDHGDMSNRKFRSDKRVCVD